MALSQTRCWWRLVLRLCCLDWSRVFADRLPVVQTNYLAALAGTGSVTCVKVGV